MSSDQIFSAIAYLGVAADGICLPLMVGPTGVGLVETRGLVIVKTCAWE